MTVKSPLFRTRSMDFRGAKFFHWPLSSYRESAVLEWCRRRTGTRLASLACYSTSNTNSRKFLLDLDLVLYHPS